MAIDRNTKYVCQWKAKSGWAMMLEIIPPGEFMTTEVFDVVQFNRSLFAMDAAGYGFEDLPIGMMKAPAISFQFDFRNLPAGLKELLKTPNYDVSAYGNSFTTTTIFTLWSDEGLGGNLFIQYIGAQAKTLGNKFTLTDYDVVKRVKIETFDLLKTMLDVSPPNSIFSSADNGIILSPYIANEITDNYFFYDYAYKADTGWKFYKRFMYTIENFTNYLGGFIGVSLAYWLRSGLFGFEQSTTFSTYPIRSLTFYEQNWFDLTAPEPGNPLDESTVYIMGHVADDLGSGAYQSFGGFFSKDKVGVSEFDSMSTFLHALCENFICKFKWKPIVQHNSTSNTNILSYEVWFLKPCENSTTPTNFSGKIIGQGYDVSTAENVFLIAESNTPDVGDKNVNLNRVSKSTSNKTDVWNTKCILHNAPTVIETQVNVSSSGYLSDDIYIETKLYPRKLYFKDVSHGGRFVKVHGSVSIDDGLSETLYDNHVEYPTLDKFKTPEIGVGVGIEIQNKNTLQQAIAEYITTYWGDSTQALRELTCKMVGGEGDGSIMPRHAGDRFNMPAITELSVGQTSFLIDAKPDWEKGTITCKFLSVKDR